MLTQFETVVAKGNIFTMHTLVHSFVGADFPKLTTITVVVVLVAAYFFADLLFLQLILFLFDLSHDIWRFFVPAKRTLNHPIILNLVFCPLHKTVQVEGVLAHSGAGGSSIASNNLHMANRAEVVIVLVLLFLYYHIPPWDLYLCILQKVRELVVMDATVCYNVAQFLIRIKVFKQQWVVQRQVEDLSEHVQCVYALETASCGTGALELVADSDLELGAVDIL